MINFMVGAPGGGKSYEAVVFHVLPALAKGRKVITNLALNVEAFAQIEPGYADLIELRSATLAPIPKPGQKPRSKLAFSQVDDYGDAWRHPVSGAGPLYVIDECHLCLPKVGTPVAVEEWYSLHRHEFADVLLLSQGYGKVNAAVRDLIQIVYRVRKNIALGSDKSYTRKVQDGVRGAVVNAAVRRYEAKYFGLYKSHTRSGAGAEMEASDIIPLWRHWSVYGVGVCVLVLAVLWWRNGSPFALFSPKAVGKPVAVAAGTESRPGLGRSLPVAVAAADKGAAALGKPAKAAMPYGGLDLHVGGWIRDARKSVVLVVFSQNGQRVFAQSSWELEKAGYAVVVVNDCLVKLTYGGASQFITCNAPQVGVGGTGGATVAAPPEGVKAPGQAVEGPVAPLQVSHTAF